MTNQNQTKEISAALLKEIADGFQTTIFNQHILLEFAKTAIEKDNRQALDALVISIDRFNNDLFHLYERVNDLCEAD
jgi:hypothetical protein